MIDAGLCFGHYSKEDKLCGKCVLKEKCIIVVARMKDTSFFDMPVQVAKPQKSVKKKGKSKVSQNLNPEDLEKKLRKLINKLKSTYVLVETKISDKNAMHIFERGDGGLFFVRTNEKYFFRIDGESDIIAQGAVSSNEDVEEILQQVANV